MEKNWEEENVVFIGVFCDFRGETWWKIVVNLWWNAWQTWSVDGRISRVKD